MIGLRGNLRSPSRIIHTFILPMSTDKCSKKISNIRAHRRTPRYGKELSRSSQLTLIVFLFFREVLSKVFEKHHLTIESYDICLRSAPTLPLSLDQPVKHLLLDDLVVTGIKSERENDIISLSLPLSLAFNSSLSLDSQRKTLGLYFWDASKHINNYAMLRPILITSPGCCSCPFSIFRGNQWEKRERREFFPKKKTTRRSIDRIGWLKLADEFCLKDLVKEKLSFFLSLSLLILIT